MYKDCGPGQGGTKTGDPIRKKVKKGWGVAPVVECLPSKCKVLSSNPSIKKNTTSKADQTLTNILVPLEGDTV
jgi:hypothetical protein